MANPDLLCRTGRHPPLSAVGAGYIQGYKAALLQSSNDCTHAMKQCIAVDL
jgi:hypothetical protein